MRRLLPQAVAADEAMLKKHRDDEERKNKLAKSKNQHRVGREPPATVSTILLRYITHVYA